MSRVVFTPAAEADISQALEWYEAQSAGLGSALVNELGAVVDRIEENPLQFPLLYRDCRRALLRRFPYGLFFRLSEDRAQVVACFHMRRHPRRWQARVS
jgi:plasmid stabilization system protein ParE